MFRIEYVVPNALENAPFTIDRPEGSYRYLFFHFSSSVTIEINGEKIEAEPGTCILYTPNEKQLFYVTVNRLNHDYIDFTCDTKEFFSDIHFPLNTPFNPKCSSWITEKIKEIQTEKNCDELGILYKEESLMIDLFLTLSRKIHHRNSRYSEKYTDEIKHNFEQIRLEMYQTPDCFSVSDLANRLGFSLPRFNELYKTYFGTTPIKDLTKARISRVKDLLREGDSTKEIIKKIGFASEEYFYRWFKKHFNMTKEEYMKKENEEHDISH